MGNEETMTKVITDKRHDYQYLQINMGNEAMKTTVKTLFKLAGVNVQKFGETKTKVSIRIK